LWARWGLWRGGNGGLPRRRPRQRPLPPRLAQSRNPKRQYGPSLRRWHGLV